MVKNSGQIIQAFPINGDTAVLANASGFEIKEHKIIHCVTDTDLVFHFGPSNSVTINALAGSDWAIGVGCTHIDSTASIIVS